jgi:flagellar L-ring protein precursor FlgH
MLKQAAGLIVLGIFMCATLAHADSLFSKRAAESGTLISAKKSRFEVGDIITVLVRENTDASTDSLTDTKKESTVEATAGAEANKFFVGKGENGLNLFSAGFLPNWSVESESEHKSDGTTQRGNALTTTISCVVTEVLGNGTIMIAGSKNIKVNRETSMLKISGMIRARDVDTDNTIQSNKIANADLQLTGDGPLNNNTRRGFLTKLFDWFSPF